MGSRILCGSSDVLSNILFFSTGIGTKDNPSEPYPKPHLVCIPKLNEKELNCKKGTYRSSSQIQQLVRMFVIMTVLASYLEDRERGPSPSLSCFFQSPAQRRRESRSRKTSVALKGRGQSLHPENSADDLTSPRGMGARSPGCQWQKLEP